MDGLINLLNEAVPTSDFSPYDIKGPMQPPNKPMQGHLGQLRPLRSYPLTVARSAMERLAVLRQKQLTVESG